MDSTTLSDKLKACVEQVTGCDNDRLVEDISAVFTEVKSLIPSATAFQGQVSLVLKGTVPTKYMGQQYMTPVLVVLPKYPAEAPVVRVVVTSNMSPQTSVKKYTIKQNGAVNTSYLSHWSPTDSNLLGLIKNLQEHFSAEPPLYSGGSRAQSARSHSPAAIAAAIPPSVPMTPQMDNSLQKLCQMNSRGPTGGYNDLPRVLTDIHQAVTKYPNLVPCAERRPHGLADLGLRGTVPCTFKGTVYNIPVAIWVPHLYPQSIKGGIPEPEVTPTPGMRIKSNHQNVDEHGNVYMVYLSQWKSAECNLMGTCEHMIKAFEKEAPVYSESGSSSRSRTPPRESEKEDNATIILRKLEAENAEVTETDDLEVACVVCMENKKDIVLIPCKHMCLCALCLRDVANKDCKCPMCRGDIVKYMQLSA